MTNFAIGILVYTTLVFLAGANWGNIRSRSKQIEEELIATRKLLTSQGDSEETKEATIALIKSKKLGELHSEKREYLAIWIPSILVVIGIAVTILTAKK
jgi:hypothetical protein